MDQAHNIVSNLKKKVDRRDKPEWRYKEAAIRQAGSELRVALGEDSLKRVTIVPMPPSLSRDNALYDDRMARIVRVMTEGFACDVRELIVQPTDMPTAHEAELRPRPDDWFAAYMIVESLATPEPVNVLLVDDVITAGSHFAGAKRRLLHRFPTWLSSACSMRVEESSSRPAGRPRTLHDTVAITATRGRRAKPGSLALKGCLDSLVERRGVDTSATLLR